ncbi:type VII secretion protein EssA [Virgibacillus sp. FSP13]
MMKVLLKRTNLVPICLLCLLLMLPYQASAEDSSDNKGELEWKIDRIIQDETGDDRKNTETELEKTFPDLFKEETTSVIQAEQVENEETMDQLETALFTMDSNGNSTINNLEQSLFTSEYTAPKTSSEVQEEKQDGSWFTNAFVIGLIGLVCAVFGGIYIMMRKLSD